MLAKQFLAATSFLSACLLLICAAPTDAAVSSDRSIYDPPVSCHLPTVYIEAVVPYERMQDEYVEANIAIIEPDQKLETVEWSTAKIRLRGHSSQKYAKKQFQLKFRDEDGEKDSQHVLDLGKSDTWVLSAPFVDRSLIRNALAYRIGRKMSEAWSVVPSHGRWFAAETRFVEVRFNNQFLGLYVVTQKIERAKDKINIEKAALNPDHPAFIGEISSGSDRDLVTQLQANIKLKNPKMDDLCKSPDGCQIMNRIQAAIRQFECAIVSQDSNIYTPKLHTESFVDYFIVQEFTKNIDGFRRSMHFVCDDEGVFSMGPLWDFNLALGNLRAIGHQRSGANRFWTHCPGRMEQWAYPDQYWYQTLLQDPGFCNRVVQRYQELRQEGGVLSDAEIDHDVDFLASELYDAGIRNEIRWRGQFGLYQRKVTRMAENAGCHRGHVELLRKWLKERLANMDREICELCRR